jgi:hypothetical protein
MGCKKITPAIGSDEERDEGMRLEICTYKTSRPVCPYCAKENNDPFDDEIYFELNAKFTTTICKGCGEIFQCERETEIFYTARK